MNSLTAKFRFGICRGCLVLGIFLLVALAPEGRAAGKKKVQAKKETTSPEIREPDHLLPVDPPRKDGYGAYVERLQTVFKLEGDPSPLMLVRPTLRAEYVLRVVSEKGTGEHGKGSVAYLSCGTADTNIWYARAENNSDRSEKTVTITTVKAEIPPPLAERLRTLWLKMLQRTQKNEERGGAYGGITYQFSADGKSGKICAPQEMRSPRLFVELGESLVKYCQLPEDDHSRGMSEVTEKMAALEDYLKNHPAK